MLARDALVAVVFLLAAACDSSARQARTPLASAPPVSDAAPLAASRQALEPPLIDVTHEEMYVGQLASNERLHVMRPSEYCLEDRRLYAGARYRLGEFNVFGLDEVLGALHAEQGLVALAATQRPSLLSHIKDIGPCPDRYEPLQVQMRSDWVPPEGGPITTRAILEALPYLEASAATPVYMFAPLDGDESSVRVRIRNPFTLPLAGLKFSLHYEGGPGKPMPSYLEEELALAPGAWTQIEVPRRLPGEQPATKSGSELRSIDVYGQLGKATLAIELSVPQR